MLTRVPEYLSDAAHAPLPHPECQVARQAAVVKQQIPDCRTDIKADWTKIAELGVNGFQAAFGNENGAAVNIAVQQRFGMREEAVLERGDRKL
jgi:hypothetical protein